MERRLLLAAVAAAIFVGACSADTGTPGDARRDSRGPDGSIITDAGDGAASDIVTPPADTHREDTSTPPPDVVVDRDTGLDATAPEDVPVTPERDVNTSDACAAGSVTCVTADRFRTCLPDGGGTEEDCPAGQLCIEGRGCSLCEPGAVRCGTDGLTLETCASDGMSWTAGTRCNTSAGEVCDGYRCVNACTRAASQRSYLGCEYWPTTMSNSQLSGVFTFAVTVANPQTYPVSFTITGGALTAPRTATVAPGSTNTQELPWVPALSQLGVISGANSALVRNGAYRLVTTAPVAVYQFNPLRYEASGANSYTNDASLLLPTHVLTGNYMALTHNTWQQLGGQIVIVGTSDMPTTVNLNLRGSIRAGTGVTASAGGPIGPYTLNRGDVLELMGAGGTDARVCTASDLTGSTITADRPVAVFVGHDCTFMPCNTGYCDHLEEQLFPNETWGRSYVVSALRERSPTEVSVIRILSRVDANVITFDGIPRPAACPAAMNSGQFCEFETANDFAVSGAGPILVGQFMVGQDRVAGQGDPALVLEVPTQQFRTNYTFNVPDSYARNFVTVVYPTGMMPRLDGSTIAAGSIVALSGFSVTRFAVTAGNHRMDGAVPFGIKVSGTGDYTSYMYPGGLDLNQITTP